MSSIRACLTVDDGKATRDTVALAFLGDALYEVFVRARLVNKGLNGDRLHSKSVIYVNANAQAEAIKTLLTELSEEEEELVKRARNHKVKSKPNNVDLRTYKWATGFEALLGWLGQQGREERLVEIMGKAVSITDGRYNIDVERKYE